MPDVEDAALEPERTEHTVSAQTNQQPLEVPPKRAVRFSRVWQRTALIAAAAITCMFAVMVMAQAAGIDLFGAMARWTKDVFSFGQIPPDSMVSEDLSGETGENKEGIQEQVFSSLQEALDVYGITEVHEPMGLPEGYALDRIDALAMDNPFLRTLSASYTDGNCRVGIDIMSYEVEPIMQVQKTEALVEQIEKDGIIFYLIQNTENYTIAWYTNQYEYYLSSKEGTDILWQVAESMFS